MNVRLRKSARLLLAAWALLCLGPLRAQTDPQSALRRAGDLVSMAYEQLMLKRDYAGARRSFEEAAAIYKAQNGPQDKRYLEAIYGLADACEKAGDLRGALEHLGLYARCATRNPTRTYLRLGTLHRKAGNRTEAANNFGACIALFERDSVRWSADVSKAFDELADLLDQTGDYPGALETYRKHLRHIERFDGRGHKYAVGLTNIATILHKKGDDREALRCYEEALAAMQEAGTLNREGLPYANLMNNMGLSYQALGDYRHARRCLTESLGLKKRLFGEMHPEYAVTLSNLGTLSKEEGDYEGAIACFERARTIYEKQSGRETVEYARTLGNLGATCDAAGQYDRALAYGGEAAALYARLLGENHPEYATALDNLASVYSDKGDYARALETYRRSLKVYAGSLGERHPDYAVCLNNIATVHHRLGELDEAKRLFTQAGDLLSRARNTEHPLYLVTLNNLAAIYADEGDYAQAVKCQRQRLDIIRKVYGEQHPDFFLTLNNLGSTYASMGDYRQAFEYLHRSEELQRTSGHGETALHAATLGNIGNLCEQIGDWSEAEKYYTQCADLRRRIQGAEHPDYAQVLGNLADLCVRKNEFDRAVEYYRQALDIVRQALGENHRQYANLLNNAGSMYNETQNPQQGEALLRRALEICEKNSLQTTSLYASALNNLAYNHALRGETQQATNLYERSAAAYGRLLGPHHPSYLTACNNIAQTAFAAGDYKRARECMESVFEATRANMRSDFAFLTGRERAGYWHQQQTTIGNVFALGAGEVDGGTAKLIYDASLLNKGLLLTTSLELERIVREANDPELTARFEELGRLHARLARLRAAAEERVSDGAAGGTVAAADSLQQMIASLERAMQARSQAYGDYTAHTVLGWQQVRDRLGPDDTAVEIVSYGYVTDTLYDAVVLRKGWKAPRHVRLFSKDELRDRGISTADMRLYDDPALLTARLWKPLEPYLSANGSVYFAPSGELYNVGIEYLPLDDSVRIGDRYDLVRLSSTRELVRRSPAPAKRSAALFGGLNYNTPVDEMELYAAASGTRGSGDRFRTPGTRGTVWSYLGGTRREVEQIERPLTERGYATALITGDEGVEERFKALTGSRTGLIHIATHGFYLPAERPAAAGGRPEPEEEQRALRRAGLLFAGANNAWLGRARLSDEIDDGILTAAEIAQLDLRGADLVVLSACQTGLGEVTGEGVFGLQRAFKKAGVQTLVMSLWEVSDQATSTMMTAFYERLGQGLSKREAFRAAQQAVREQSFLKEGKRCSGEDPYFWASFILLD
ncbi:tetratricopeptide repeat protein [Alistipes sp.]|uniref:tetratricopeptide repeat protein n=1 Tax=Alistipes sp. TaxID=1872444 RepID=UPI003AF1C36E